MASINNVDNEAPSNAKEKENRNKRLVKKGFINYKIPKYAKDIHSSSISTNKCRWGRVLFLAHQLARDAGVQLLIFGYFPNQTVGSCGSWTFGNTMKLLKKKSDTTKYYKYWEKVFSLIEAQRQKNETVEVGKCHEAATFNVSTSVNMDGCESAWDVESESEVEDGKCHKAAIFNVSASLNMNGCETASDVENESEVEALEKIPSPSEKDNSMGTLE
ncbi:hypothetical protein GHT06_013391 [Daphnia sinensis]|uniref:Uncharacterized protein n=1 Tax=Daphnia sinensis TaxID=1820382 RepID=A0AAD5LGU1_9CRUS|nr:hypothetical protein GHT06_013391 [Daphnia sinensis]